MKNLPQTIIFYSYFMVFAGFIFLISTGCNSSAPKAGTGDMKGFELVDLPGSTVKSAKRRDPSGQVVMEGFLDGDKKTGMWMEYNNDGDISSIESYINGMLEGPSLKLSFRGQVDQRTNYHLNQMDGPWVQYKFGKVMETREYQAGKLDGSVKLFDQKTYKLRQETEYKNGLQDGHFRYYDDEGNVSVEYEYKKGEKVRGGIVKK
ncbi:MAG: hypothetical protein ABIQ02_07515 [Saprospiraceae bacterium]